MLGRADVGEIAKELPQERSVISRHLQVLHDAQIVKATKVGRQVFYEVNGGAIVERLEAEKVSKDSKVDADALLGELEA